jgi:nitrite reductase/ring-hydroxylating ferredoxin subunit
MTQTQGAMTQPAQIPEHLTRVATYRRTVPVSLERVWENVLDWEHLPWLHDSSFLDAEVREAGDWGWRATLGLPSRRGRREIDLELLIQEPGDRYVSRTTRGRGAGTEIWTILEPRGPAETAVEVAFWLPNVPPERSDEMGSVYTRLYTQLWDEDDQMMRDRQAELDREAPRLADREGLDLGHLEVLRTQLPLEVEVDGLPFRVVLEGEDLLVHSTRCPHRLGPLAASADEAGVLRCPWHGYQFDSRSGASCDGRRLRLEPAPGIRIDPCSAHVRLVWDLESGKS